MICPTVLPRVKERRHRPTFGIDANKVGSFVKIAAVACECQVNGIVPSSMLLWDNRLDMVREHTVLLAKLAVLATIVRAFADGNSRRGIHH
jgi:hypothetical protein